MNTSIRVPDDAIRYLLYQRTAYQLLPRLLPYKVIKKLSPWKLDHLVVGLESRWRRGRIERLFNEDFQREYTILAPSLPRTCTKILDIGCGVGGIDVLLHRHYAAQSPDFHLVDKTSVDRSVFYGFKQVGAFYNSLDAAKNLLVTNGVPAECVHLHQATDDHRIDVDQPVDLAISLISWGYHYPVETYLDRVHELLAADGRLILDLRIGTDGERLIRERFANVQALQTTDKYVRVVAGETRPTWSE